MLRLFLYLQNQKSLFVQLNEIDNKQRLFFNWNRIHLVKIHMLPLYSAIQTPKIVFKQQYSISMFILVFTIATRSNCWK